MLERAGCTYILYSNAHRLVILALHMLCFVSGTEVPRVQSFFQSKRTAQPSKWVCDTCTEIYLFLFILFFHLV